MGCGELVMELKFKMREIEPGDVVKVIATDTGAREDMPAWCKLTGHTLLDAAHPAYIIKKKGE
ncbi:MAG: sulfurtransferase TusA family protein [Cyanobacteria bacterium]|nr:sulfurtransferase TusA family protein [Cyanobacteriota bacterium]